MDRGTSRTSTKDSVNFADEEEEKSPICILKKFKDRGYNWSQVNHVSNGVPENKLEPADETTLETVSAWRPKCFRSAMSKSVVNASGKLPFSCSEEKVWKFSC